MLLAPTSAPSTPPDPEPLIPTPAPGGPAVAALSEHTEGGKVKGSVHGAASVKKRKRAGAKVPLSFADDVAQDQVCVIHPYHCMSLCCHPDCCSALLLVCCIST